MTSQSKTSQEKADVLSFQELILTLQAYWARHGCVLLQPYDVEMGAGGYWEIVLGRFISAISAPMSFTLTCVRNSFFVLPNAYLL